MDRRSFMGALAAAPAAMMPEPGFGEQNLQFVQGTTLPQARVIGVHMNSAWWHSDFGCVPLWLHRMCVADGGKNVAARGQWDDFNTPFKNPPKFDQRFPETASPSPGISSYSTWAQQNLAAYTDVVYVPENFQGPPMFRGDSTDPSSDHPDGLPPSPGADDYVTEFTETISIREANSNRAVTHWLYEIWADGAQEMRSDGSASARRFAAWKARTTTGVSTPGYGAWFDQLLAGAQANLPEVAPRIRMIPVARTLVSVMDNTAASALSSGDWFEDDAPHGRHHLYAVVAAMVYSMMFEEVAPQPDFTGATIHSTIASNWSDIASHIFSYLDSAEFIAAS